MREFMRRTQYAVALLLILSVFTLNGTARHAGQQPQQQERQPGPGKKFVYTPFGPLEVDISDPRPAIAVGPPLQPAPPPPTQVPAQPAQVPPAAAPPPTPVPAQDDPIVPINLRFDNQDIYGVVRIIADVLRINYIIDPMVRGNVTMSTSGDLRRSDLLPLLEAILKMNGATMVRLGNLYQIVPASSAPRMPIQVQDAQQPVAPDDQIVLQVIAMKFVAAEEMSKLLMPYLSEGGSIVVQGNILLVSDRRSNLRKLLEIVDLFDTRAFQGERVRLFQVKNSNAKDLVDDLRTVFAGYALSDKNSAIRFLPMERLNSILVITPNPSIFGEVERWMERLDQPLLNAGVRNFVYRAKNTKAVEIQRVLQELYTGTQSPTPGATPAQAPPPAGQPATPPPGGAPTTGAPGAAPAAAAPENTAARLSGQLHIVADSINNALVIQATPQDYQVLERTIQELDVLPRQVLIDAQIYEVVLDHSLSLGLSAILQNRGTLANPQTTASFQGSPPALAVTTFAFIGRTRELVAFLNASENRSRVRTLSAPSILVSNNVTAQVQVGSEVPIPTSSSVTPVQQSGTNLFAQTIQFRDTGVILSVTPQINDGGNVTLSIAQEVSQAGANTTSAIVAPVIGKSAVKSTIVVQDGETIPLTGFMRETDTLARARVPLLGSIPGVGVLFGNTNKSSNRTELIVLITPHVVTTVDERAAAAEELKTKLKETRRLIQ
jgi:general secretion pathway protein D